ncbi:MAG: hypothetical protein GYB67_04220, partial [Chloroflexi bacterium]|nr:hypothetical protein [Chloroflexota bacterium]
MARQKPAETKPAAAKKTSPPKAQAQAEAQPPAETQAEPAEKYPIRPEFWEQLFDSIPPWGDEIAAILLIVFGIVSGLSLLNISADATISTAWANALTSLFGYGSAVICLGIFALGVIILLPKLGIVIRFPTRRILALEIAFLSILALLHLAVSGSDPRTAAFLGQGGGQVGWALSAIVENSLSWSVAVTLYALLLVISMANVMGLNRTHLAGWLQATTRS